ncbi:potassium channel family protein [Microbulbifer sp. CnH-101-E]|uniref:potassium channel family protein n=1 Tax=unclassified Microbulbifer TaxID=2619833 RepID=UPI00403957F4
MQRFLSWLSWKKLLFCYVAAILFFAIIYYFLRDSFSFNEEEMGLIQTIYFSIVTITTLGYGEVHPKNEIGYFWTALEALVGIFAFGLLLNELAKHQADQQERKRQALIAEQLIQTYDHFLYITTYLVIQTVNSRESGTWKLWNTPKVTKTREYLFKDKGKNFQLFKDKLEKSQDLQLDIMSEYLIFSKQVEFSLLHITPKDQKLFDFLARIIKRSTHFEHSPNRCYLLELMIKDIITGNPNTGGLSVLTEPRDHDLYREKLEELKAQVS